jgi:adenosylmethionine-8-amino-7-oxononanoate aminotransferase
MNASKRQNPLFYQTSSEIPLVSRAEGIYIWDEDGKRYIDGSSGAVICNIGHGDPTILAAITQQAQSTFFTYRT